MKKTLCMVLVLLAAGSGILCAATIGDKAGTTSGEFLRLGAGARAAGMGEAFGAVADDVSAVYWNPAGIAAIEGRQVLLAHTMWYMDVNHEYAAYAQPLPKGLGAIGVSFTYLMTTFEKRTGDTAAADSNGEVGDMAVGVTYARMLPAGIKGGVSAKYISSKLDAYTGTSVAFDLGFQKRLPYWGKRINLGLSALNLGGSLKYISDTVPIGSTLDAGVAVRDAGVRNLSVALDYRMLMNASWNSINAGVEYGWTVSQDLVFAPRLGYENGNSALTAGFGVQWKAYRLDYAFMSHSDLDTNNRISFGVKF